ncbi:hypothetical protein HMPREF3086_10965 [Dietzia sp. HMSC21D01]|uniref:Mce-associated membrane protein n=1 Tax=Dietzia cinnamea TaxID=321318 RepID=A0AAW5QAW7_9ACTN|nr:MULTISPECIES: hypothetical protein [Dietzia]PWD96377.1 hypothetical protein DEQ16_05820 [Dietzia maris]MBM7229107.1 hypothetical protein [Dietzia cinnamea]MCT1864414.1 hypothetical protein [Dietzia cinnamea]MCT2030498.1 hypothetical protein [Dietzia cinnamea]MCT2033897.1 hypothetical protein [Dietzia cinnamea]
MPPIKRTQKQATPQARRRLAGHSGPIRPATTAGTAAPATDDAQDAATDGDTGERTPRRRPPGVVLASAAVAVGLVAGATGAFLATEPGVSVENRAFVDQQATDEVLAAATTNVQRLVAIDHEKLDEYQASLGEFLTPDLVEELERNWPALRDSYEQTATTVDALVREAGLSYLQGDKAEVLLVQDVSMSRDGAAAGSTSGTYLVGLDKVDGVWKLSRIPDLPS